VRVTVVGCSGSLPGPRSAASCYLVEAEGPDGAGGRRTWRLLLDLGNGAVGQLQNYVELHQVDAVALSHLHADHCLDLCGMYVALKYRPAGPSTSRLPVHGPAGTAARLARAYDIDADPGMGAELDVREWQPGEPVHIGPLRLTPYRVLHPVEAYAIRVEGPSDDPVAGTVVLAYSGDTDICPGLAEAAEGADVLLSEAAFQEGRDEIRGVHLTGRRAAQVARDADVGLLVLTHLPPWNDAATTVAQARAVWDGELEVARPGLQITL